ARAPLLRRDPVMVAEEAFPDGAGRAGLHVEAEAARVSDGGDEEDRSIERRSPAGGPVAPAPVGDERGDRLRGVNHRGPGVDAQERGVDGSVGAPRSMSVQHDDVRAPQGRKRLTQRASGNDAVVAQGLTAVDHYDVEIPMEPAVLEPVVENESRVADARGDRLSRSVTIPRDAEPGRGRAAAQEGRFVAHERGVDLAARRADVGARAVASSLAPRED